MDTMEYLESGQLRLTAMLRASQEKMRATVIAIQSAQDHCKGSGNEILGTKVKNATGGGD
jgi:hypothetical protein